MMGTAVAALLLLVAAAGAHGQNAAQPAPVPESQMTVPDGYSVHSSVDVGGRINNTVGSGAMYNTLVNMQSGPRVTGQSFELRKLDSNKKGGLVDELTAFSTGFGGDPYNIARLNFSKGKLYDFSGLFRRDRQYFDYNLLGNPNIPGNQTIPISGSTTPYTWSQVMQSPFMFNTVRRMTDTDLTLLPLSKVTFRFAYSQNIFQGPSQTPSGYQIAGSYDLLLQEMQRNSTDDWRGSVEWKPLPQTHLTYEEQITHYKGDSYFSMAPQYFNVQEADGTKVALLMNYDSPLNGAVAATCNSSVGSAKLYAPSTPGGLPIVDPACSVITSYSRYQPIREIFPTEIFRLQSSSIRNVTMNGNIRYTSANMNMPNYVDNFQGLAGAASSSTGVIRELNYLGYGNAKREVIAVDYGATWQATKKFSLSEQIDFSNVHQPGVANITSWTTVATPATAGSETINNPNLTTTVITTPTYTNPNTGKSAASSTFEGSPTVATPQYDYFGQKFITNNITASYDVTNRTTLSLTYRHEAHTIAEGAANNVTYQSGLTIFAINQDGGIFSVATHPTSNLDLNGSVEVLYADNVFTPVAPRELQHYRVHALYRPKAWATIAGAYNDLERHNNTNNTGTPSAVGPLDHVDHSRIVSLNTDLMPNEHYGFDISYNYSDVYAATNICFLSNATALQNGGVAPGALIQSGNLCSPIVPPAHGTGNTVLSGPAKDFEDAPTQYASVALALSPVDKFHAHLGYRLSSVNGSRFFNDARDVNGSLVSTYQSPFVDLAYALHKNLIWKAEYNYFGYGEGGPSGTPYCNANTAPAVGLTVLPVTSCASVPNTALSGPAYGFTSPRNFHANNVLLGVHYEF